MKPASVIIMDEHPIVRMSIEVLLQKNKNIQVKLKSGDSHEVLDFYAGRAIRAGANGFVSKRKDLGEIYNAVEMILTGYSFFPSETLSFINHLGSRTGAAVDMPLSNREVTVLRYLANGLSNKEIADQLLLSNKTISAHKSNIFSKLGVQSIVELIDYAKAHELL